MNRIEKVPLTHNYEGYLWYSDQQQPFLVKNSLVAKKDKDGKIKRVPLDDTHFAKDKLPFVIEGNLYCKEDNISIQIKGIDGQYYITKYNVKDAPKKDIKSYMVHRIDGFTHYKMYEAWKEQSGNESLENIPTLVPAFAAFMGFTNDQK